MNTPDIVRLNVGGLIFTTSRSTLCKYPDSMLGAMFGGKFEITYDDAGCAFIDRDGKMFRHVLNFIRTGTLLIPKEFNEFDLHESEADFYQIRPLSDALMEQKRNIIGRNTTLELDYIFVSIINVKSSNLYQEHITYEKIDNKVLIKKSENSSDCDKVSCLQVISRNFNV